MFTFLALTPALFFMLLAHLGRRYSWARMAIYVFFGLVNALFLLDGVLLLVRGGTFQITIDGATITSEDLSPQFLGYLFLGVGGTALLLMMTPVQRILSLFMRLRPGDSVHTLALVYASYLVGLSMGQTPFLRVLLQNQTSFSLPASELLGQAAAFTLLAFIGAGLGTTRSVAETVRRLQLTWPGVRELRAAVLTTIVLILLQMVLGALWMVMSPDQAQEIDEMTRSLLGEFFSVQGAVILGISTGISEELLFRGALQPRFGLLITSALFSLVHSQYMLSFAVVVVFLLGLLLGIVRNRVNTTAAILAHALYNTTLVMLAIYGLQ